MVPGIYYYMYIEVYALNHIPGGINLCLSLTVCCAVHDVNVTKISNSEDLPVTIHLDAFVNASVNVV